MTTSPEPSLLTGVRYGAITRHGDLRGSFRELWRADAFQDVDSRHTGPTGTEVRFVQSNLSSSAAGVLRGLHMHLRQMDHWVVTSGRAFVALVDVRPLLDGSGPSALVETRILDANETVTIPIGVAHGFLALSPLELVYFVTNEFDGSDELGFAWDDPAVPIEWPVVGTADGRPILSPRDEANPSLSDLVASFKG